MKNKFLSLVTIILCVSLLVSCGKNSVKDEHGCYNDYEAAVKYAKAKKLPLLVFFTSESDNEESKQIITDIFKNPGFSSDILKHYAVFHADFSADEIQTSYQLAMLFNVAQMPSVFLCTKEGYVVSKIESEDEFLGMEEFKTILDSEKDRLESFNQMVAATGKGNTSEKVEAIDTLYMATQSEYRSFLIELVQKVTELDKTNATGLAGKYILALAEAKAVTAFSQGDTENAVEEYLQAANNDFLKAEEKQECFYTAAYLAAYSGSEDYEGIMSYLQTSYDLAPQSEKAPAIKEAIEYFKLIRENIGKNDYKDVNPYADEK